MKLFRESIAVLPIALGLLGVVSAPLAAQSTTTTTTTTATTTCTTAPTGLTALSIERVLQLSNIESTITPSIPANVLASLTAGAMELRERLIYNPQANTVTSTLFTVASGSPIPTSLATDVTGSTLASFTIVVSNTWFTCSPTPALLLAGTINASTGPFGNFNGALAAVSLGYSTDSTPLLNNVVDLVAGNVAAYSPAASGTLTFPAAPVSPGGTAGQPPVIVLSPSVPTAPAVLQVQQNNFQISAAQSTDPQALALSYAWSSDAAHPINFQPSATVSNPTLVFQAGGGDYTITLTVTDTAGNKATMTFIIEYL
jgi:hypothetical protein